MTELVQYQPQTALTEQMDYAKAVADGSLLPDAYRGKPANVLIAVGLGSAMGLSPAESLYRIDVIQGKPTASAELIAANVRKAGHKLRVRGDNQSATAQIIRVDDPDYVFEVTRDMAWAQRMGLASRDQYKKQPGTMLQYRAITAVARLACPEALYGVAYTADEMFDAPPMQEQRSGGGLAAALAPQTGAGGEAAPQATGDDVAASSAPPASQHDNGSITKAQLTKLHTALSKVGLTDRNEALAYYARVTGRAVESSKDLSKWEAGQVIDDLERAEKGEPNALDQQPAAEVDPTTEPGWGEGK